MSGHPEVGRAEPPFRADETTTRGGIAAHLAWVEEHARHCGHADLIRESPDASTGP